MFNLIIDLLTKCGFKLNKELNLFQLKYLDIRMLTKNLIKLKNLEKMEIRKKTCIISMEITILKIILKNKMIPNKHLKRKIYVYVKALKNMRQSMA